MTASRSLLARPVALAAIGLLVLNDHWAKSAYPGLVTGKISDFAGLVFFPLFVVAAIELVLGRQWRSRAVIVAVTTICLAVFAAINVSHAAGEVWATALGHAQWLPRVTWAVLSDTAIPPSMPVAHTVDPTDLLAAIPGAAVAATLGHRGAEGRAAAVAGGGSTAAVEDAGLSAAGGEGAAAAVVCGVGVHARV